MTNRENHWFAAKLLFSLFGIWFFAMVFLAWHNSPAEKQSAMAVAIFLKSTPKKSIHNLKLAKALLVSDIGSKIGFNGRILLVNSSQPALKERLTSQGALTLPVNFVPILPSFGGCLFL